MNKIKLIIGIILCTWYFPGIALVALINATVNSSSSVDLLFPLILVLSYVFGIIVIGIPPRVKKEVKVIEKKVDDQKKMSSIICWKCQAEYQFLKNTSGDTIVKCPNCGEKGKVRQ